MPELDFAITEAQAVPYAAAPTLRFGLQIRNTPADETIQSIMLHVQVRIEPRRRHYDAAAERALLELFGEPARWGDTLRSFLWTHATVLVPRFTGSSVTDLPIACTYDFDVAAAKYFHALADGEIPLLFLFSGTIFTASAAGGVQIAQIPWEKEATFRLPVARWKELMQRYFPNSAWLRLRRDVFDQLYRYKAANAHPTWEAALEALLRTQEVEATPR